MTKVLTLELGEVVSVNSVSKANGTLNVASLFFVQNTFIPSTWSSSSVAPIRGSSVVPMPIFHRLNLWNFPGGLVPNILCDGASAVASSLGMVDPSGVTSGNYPTAGQIPTFTVDASGRITAAGSTTSGAGSVGVAFDIGIGLGFGGANYRLGVSNDAPSNLLSALVPWIAPANGTLKNLQCRSNSVAPGNLQIIVDKATNPGNAGSTTGVTYSATTLIANVNAGNYASSDTTHSVSVNAGDFILIRSDTLWTCNGFVATMMFIPS